MAKKERARATDAEVESRTSIVLDLLLQGLTRSQIHKNKECKSWKLCTRQMDDYMAMASSEIREINLSEREDNLARIKSNLWKLYRDCLLVGERAEVRKILMDIAKVCGLEETSINLKGDMNIKHMDLQERIDQVKGEKK